MAKLSRRVRRVLGVPAGIVAAALVSALVASGALFRLEVLTLDARLSLRGPLPLDPRVVLIAVDDETFNLLGWPIARGMYAMAIDAAVRNGARAVGFDILFTEPSADEAQDALLAARAKACNCVVFPSQLRLEDGHIVREEAIAPLRAVSVAEAHVQLDNTADGTFRALPLSLLRGDGSGGEVPALSIALVRAAGLPLHLPNDRPSGTAWLGWRDAPRTVSLIDVLEAVDAQAAGEPPPQRADGSGPKVDLAATFKDSVVLIGQTALSVGDRGSVPLASDAPLVNVHANAVDNALHGRLTAPPPTWLAVLLTFALALGVGVAVTGMRAAPGTLTAAALIAATWAAGTWAFSDSETWLPLAGPSLAAGLAYVFGSVLNVWVRDADERKLRAAFDKYVAPHILDRVIQNPDNVDIRGHRRTITLLFSDIKGYTTLSNTLQPDEIVELLCTYLDTMVEIILVNEGTVDKIMGDGIMAFFGDPLPQQDHALRSIKCGLAMQHATAELGSRWVARGLSPLQVRIGIATGEVFVGSIGSRHHLEYTAIGRPVNLAARLEGKAPPGGVLVSAETYELVKDQVNAREVRGLDLKGYSGGYDAWLIVGLAGEGAPQLDVDQRQGSRTPFFSNVTLSVDGVALEARSSDISPGGMFVHCDVAPPMGKTVRVAARLKHAGKDVTVQMDAVVSHVREGKAGVGGVGLMFTAVFADDRAAIEALLEGVIGHESFEPSRVREADDEARGKLAYRIDAPPA